MHGLMYCCSRTDQFVATSCYLMLPLNYVTLRAVVVETYPRGKGACCKDKLNGRRLMCAGKRVKTVLGLASIKILEQIPAFWCLIESGEHTDPEALCRFTLADSLVMNMSKCVVVKCSC